MKKRLIIVSIVGILVVVGVIWWLKRTPVAQNKVVLPTVAVTKVVRGNLEHSVVLPAEFYPYQQIDVHAKVSGYVKEIRVDIGDHVKTGDTIAVLEVPELNDDLHHATAEVEAARQQIKNAEANYTVKHAMFVRLSEVAKQQPNLVAQQDVDNVKSADNEAQAEVSAAYQHEAACEAEQKKFQTMLDYSVITAPFDGVVTKRYADTGALIQAGTASNTQSMPLVSLLQNNVLRLRFPVPDWAVKYVHVGQAVDISVEALNMHFSGKIIRDANHVDRGTRTMVTEVDVPNPTGVLTAGMYATVNIATEQKKHVLTIPVQSLVQGANPKVYVIGKDNKLEEHVVQVGLQTPQSVEILSGLKENELIVVGGKNLAKPGQQVIPKNVQIATTAANSTKSNG